MNLARRRGGNSTNQFTQPMKMRSWPRLDIPPYVDASKPSVKGNAEADEQTRVLQSVVMCVRSVPQQQAHSVWLVFAHDPSPPTRTPTRQYAEHGRIRTHLFILHFSTVLAAGATSPDGEAVRTSRAKAACCWSAAMVAAATTAGRSASACAR